ncbi:MAG: helix-turn-helix transcriptional regulator [Ruminococcaceae bacterium]|jgi:transcriptional regulator with XRE-family HTH domain|nr:helix-turn-helix transcriptional regulator [Oscillospiraceae bacterium]
MLPIGERIRSLRRAKDETQEDLAQVLGVSYQAVSRWENGDAYPDIELLPKLAAHYGVTTDELLGADEETVRADKERRKQELFDEINRCIREKDRKKQYETALAAFREFPDEYRFANGAAEILAYFEPVPREEGLPVFRELTRKMLEQSVPTWRFFALRLIYVYEDEDRLKDWNAFVPPMILSRDTLMENRYMKGPYCDAENATAQKQLNLFNLLTHCFTNGFFRPADPGASAELKDLELRVIDCLRDPSDDRDGWLNRRMCIFLSKAWMLFEAGRKEEGYEALEKAIRLYELLFSIPEEEMLLCNSPLFSKIAVTRSGSAYRREDGAPEWQPAGSENEILSQIIDIRRISVLFPSVAEEPRMKALISRIPPAGS